MREHAPLLERAPFNGQRLNWRSSGVLSIHIRLFPFIGLLPTKITFQFMFFSAQLCPDSLRPRVGSAGKHFSAWSSLDSNVFVPSGSSTQIRCPNDADSGTELRQTQVSQPEKFCKVKDSNRKSYTSGILTVEFRSLCYPEWLTPIFGLQYFMTNLGRFGIILLSVFGSEEASDCSFRNVRTFAAPDVRESPQPATILPPYFRFVMRVSYRTSCPLIRSWVRSAIIIWPRVTIFYIAASGD